MNGWLRALRRELGQGLPRLTFVVIAVTMAVLLWSKGAYWGGRWNALATQSREYLILIAPITATLAAWQGGRTRRDQVGELLTSTRASALARQSTEVAAIVIAAIAGWLLAIALAGVSIIRLDGWGTAAAAYQILGVAPTLFAYVTLGFAIGTALPWRIVAPLMGVATYLLIGIPSYGSDAVPVLLGNGYVGDDVYRAFSARTFWVSIAGLSLIALTLLALSSLERRPAPSRTTRITAIAAGAAAVVLAPITLTSAAAALHDGPPPNPPVVCTTDNGPKVCVHAQDRLLLAQTTRQAREVIAKLAGTQGAPTWAGPWQPDVQDRDMLTVQSAQIDIRGRIDTTYGESQLVNTYAFFDPAPACREAGLWQNDPDLELPEEMQAFNDRTWPLTDWLVGDLPSGFADPNADELNQRFAASTEAQRRNYAVAVRTAALACDVTAVRDADQHLAPAP